MEKASESIFTKFIYRLYYGRSARTAFKRREKQINSIDKRLAFAICGFIFCAAAAGAAASAFFKSIADKRWLFLIIAALSMLAMLFYALSISSGRKMPIGLHYLYFTALFAAVLTGGILNEYSIKTLYCMMMVLLPMFIMDKPGRINLYFLMVAAAFISVNMIFEFEGTESAVLTCAAAFAASCFVSRYAVRSRLSEMARKAHIERERDTDGLTRLFTRAAAVRDISAFLRSGTDRQGECALFLIDIDNFKNVNDTLGHGCGDKLLVDISNTIRGLLRRSDYVSRLGGDEFIIFLAELPSREWVNAKAAAINAALCKTVTSGKNRVMVSASIGIAFADGSESSYETLYRNADVAMYMAKQAGGNSFTVYSKQRMTQGAQRQSIPYVR